MSQAQGRGSDPRRWLPVALVALVVVAIVAGVAVWLGQREATQETLSPSTSVDVFYVGGTAEKAWLFPEQHSVVGEGSQLELAVNEALGTPLDPDYQVGFPAGTSASVRVSGDTATIDLRGSALEADPARVASTDGSVAVQALVHTVAANSDRDLEVVLQVAGQAPEVLLGQQLDGPVPMRKADNVLSPVRLALDEGALLRPGATVTGTAAAFEGTVLWEITGLGGGTVQEGFTTTEECCRPMPFSITLPELPAGSYVLRVAESDPSGGEGFPPAEDSKTFTLG